MFGFLLVECIFKNNHGCFTHHVISSEVATLSVDLLIRHIINLPCIVVVKIETQGATLNLSVRCCGLVGLLRAGGEARSSSYSRTVGTHPAGGDYDSSSSISIKMATHKLRQVWRQRKILFRHQSSGVMIPPRWDTHADAQTSSLRATLFVNTNNMLLMT